MNIDSKINRGLGCGFFVSTVFLTACSPAKVPDSPQPKAYSISGIELGIGESDVYELLGAPDQYETINLGDLKVVYYDGLSIRLIAGGMRLDSPKVVFGLSATSPQHCFDAVICPGAALQTVRERLGPAEIEPATDKPKRLTYFFEEWETCWLDVFTDDEETISEVLVACQS